MRSGWRVGSIFGIPLLVDPSWFFILALFTLSYGSSLQRQGLASGIAWIAGLAMALSLFGSVLLHELGHSLVARSQGITVNSITLFLFGGIASIDEESKTPGQAFQVAIAGPMVSFALFLVLGVASQVIPGAGATDNPVQLVLSNLAGINLVLALFNMIPGLPLDGGQVLKAAVWKASGSRLKGLRWAARSGQTLGWTAIILGALIYLQSPRGIGALWIALVGWFVVRNAAAYSSFADLQEAILGLQASTVMTRDFRVVDANLTLEKFTEDYLLREEKMPPPAFFATLDGRYRGMIIPEELQEIERSTWRTMILDQIVHPLTEIPSVTETTLLTEVIDYLERKELRRITVLSPAGAVAGVIDRGDVVRGVAEKLKVTIPDTLIQRIKEEGAYPPGLPLQAIAKAASQNSDR